MIGLLWFACSTSPLPRDEDGDRDGFAGPSVPYLGADCDDEDPVVHPEAGEVCGNGVDDDCDGNAAPCGVLGWLSADDAWIAVELPASHVVASPAGDADGDGISDVALAAPDDAGAVWLVQRGRFGASVRLWREGAVAGGRLGYALAGPIDADGDGAAGVVLGYPGLSDRASFGGGAIVAEPGRDDVVLAGTEAFAYAGSALATLDDGRGVVIGAPFASPRAWTGGAAYVFTAPTASAPLEAADFVAAGDVEGLELGTGVAAADLDGDGVDEVIATGLVEEQDEYPAFGAWVWERAGGTAVPADAIAHVAWLPGPGVASACDADGDGRDDLVLSGAWWPGPVTGELSDGQAPALAAEWLACAGDLDGDGQDEVVVAAAVATPRERLGALDEPYASGRDSGAAVGDLDGDGFGDVVLVSGGTAGVFSGGIGW